MSVQLYRWPDAGKFGRVIPKTRFYAQGTVPSAVRDKFVVDVQRIAWAYKLAESTIRLHGTPNAPEIQVFFVDVKDPEADVSDEVLAAIDRAVQFPVIFEVNRRTRHGSETRMVAADKSLGGSRLTLSSYYTTSWMPADAERAPLPPALDISALHTALVAPLLPMPARPGERLSEATSRIKQAARLQREIDSLKKKLRNEPQLKRKFELRRRLNDVAATLAGLIETTPKTKG